VDDMLRRASELDRLADEKEAAARWLAESEEARGLCGLADAVRRQAPPDVFSGGAADRLHRDIEWWNEVFQRIDWDCRQLAEVLLREATAHREEAASLRQPLPPLTG
jgi:hypothetical protein